MHMADALLSPAVGGTMWAISAGAIAYCSGKLRKELDDRKVPLMGVLGAFLFAAQMIQQGKGGVRFLQPLQAPRVIVGQLLEDSGKTARHKLKHVVLLQGDRLGGQRLEPVPDRPALVEHGADGAPADHGVHSQQDPRQPAGEPDFAGLEKPTGKTSSWPGGREPAFLPALVGKF